MFAGSSATLSPLGRLRPVALRPTLSNGLPLSSVFVSLVEPSAQSKKT